MITIESCSAQGKIKMEETEHPAVAFMIAETALKDGALYVEMRDGDQDIVKLAEHVEYPIAFA